MTTAEVLGLVAVVLSCTAAVVAVLAFRRSQSERQRGLRLDLSLALLRHEKGLRLLTQHAGRREQWWLDAPDADRQEIDRALSMWELVAWYAHTGRIDRDVVLELFRGRIVDMWEQAYPYIQQRRVEQPELWSSLTELYVDAYDAMDPLSAERLPPVELAAPTPEPVAAPAPEPVSEAAREPVVAAAPEPVPAEVIAEVAVPAAEPDRRLVDLRAALHQLDEPPPTSPPTPHEQVIDLVLIPEAVDARQH